MSDHHATVIFCDDFRQELGGKFSLMGLYAGYLAIPVEATRLPKFVAVVLADLGRDTPTPQVSIELKFDDQAVEMVAEPDPLSEQVPKGAPVGRLHVALPLQATNVPVIAGTTVFTVAVRVGEELIGKGTLPVVFQPSA